MPPGRAHRGRRTHAAPGPAKSSRPMDPQRRSGAISGPGSALNRAAGTTRHDPSGRSGRSPDGAAVRTEANLSQADCTSCVASVFSVTSGPAEATTASGSAAASGSGRSARRTSPARPSTAAAAQRSRPLVVHPRSGAPAEARATCPPWPPPWPAATVRAWVPGASRRRSRSRAHRLGRRPTQGRHRRLRLPLGQRRAARSCTRAASSRAEAMGTGPAVNGGVLWGWLPAGSSAARWNRWSSSRPGRPPGRRVQLAPGGEQAVDPQGGGPEQARGQRPGSSSKRSMARIDGGEPLGVEGAPGVVGEAGAWTRRTRRGWSGGVARWRRRMRSTRTCARVWVIGPPVVAPGRRTRPGPRRGPSPGSPDTCGDAQAVLEAVEAGEEVSLGPLLSFELRRFALIRARGGHRRCLSL